MRKWIFCLALALSAMAANADEKGSEGSLFPVNESGQQGLRRVPAEDYSKGLRALSEGSLTALAKDRTSEAYRLTIISGWGGNLDVVKIAKSEGDYGITRLKGDRRKGGEPGKLLESQTAKLISGKVVDFAKVFAASSFFKIPTYDDHWGDDGAVYILEAVKDGKYHVVVRWSPEQDDPAAAGFVAVCHWLTENVPGKEPPFFPQDEKGKAGIPRLDESWYSVTSHLRALQQHSLMPLTEDNDAEVYRLTCLPPSSRPLAVILARKDGSCEITYVEEDGTGSREAGKLAESRTARLNATEVKGFDQVFAASSFFSSDFTDSRDRAEGSEWILEAVKDGNYHVVVRWGADSRAKDDPVAPFVAVCRWLLEHTPKKEAGGK